MTSDVAATATGVPADHVPASPSPWRDWAEHAAIVLFLGWWAFPLTHDSGGRGALSLGWALLAAVPPLGAVRPWRTAPVASLFAAAVSAAALLVCAVAPTGWAGSD